MDTLHYKWIFRRIDSNFRGNKLLYGISEHPIRLLATIFFLSLSLSTMAHFCLINWMWFSSKFALSTEHRSMFLSEIIWTSFHLIEPTEASTSFPFSALNCSIYLSFRFRPYCVMSKQENQHFKWSLIYYFCHAKMYRGVAKQNQFIANILPFFQLCFNFWIEHFRFCSQHGSVMLWIVIKFSRVNNILMMMMMMMVHLI